MLCWAGQRTRPLVTGVIRAGSAAPLMRARTMTETEREAQIVALWRGRPREQRRSEDVTSFYQWLVDYAPWLVPPGNLSLDQVRALVLADTVETDSLSHPVVKAPRRRRPRPGG